MSAAVHPFRPHLCASLAAGDATAQGERLARPEFFQPEHHTELVISLPAGLARHPLGMRLRQNLHGRYTVELVQTTQRRDAFGAAQQELIRALAFDDEATARRFFHEIFEASEPLVLFVREKIRRQRAAKPRFTEDLS